MDDEGVQFPRYDGGRSTQRTGREVLAHAATACDPGLSAAIRDEPAWRRAYPTHLRALTACSAVSPATGAAVAAAGLARLHQVFTHDAGGTSTPLAAAMAAPQAPGLGTRVVTGTGVAAGLSIPYRGRILRDAELLAAAEHWRQRGVVEPAVVTALTHLVAHPEWLDLSGTWFGVLGAGAEMAPTEHLLRWGADVVAVDLARPQIWRRLEALATAGSGRLHVPVDDDGAGPLGADLVAAAPRVRAWLAAFDRPLVLGNYAYADGATFARVSVAADAVIAGLGEQRDDHGVVCLATPTDVFAVHEHVVDDVRRRAGRVAATLGRGVRLLSAGRLLVPNYRETTRTSDGHEVGLADSVVLQQGPNYALAKRMQRWRALATRAAGGFGAVHVAPPTRTRSVLKNRVLAAAYAGASLFGVETFAPATSRALMAALLVHDLRTHQQAAGGAPAPVAEHDLTAAAVHGGLWRVPWEPRSALPLAVLRGAPALLTGGRGGTAG